jgi:protocatechuate 3,4-dioxygenase beta subunit
MALGRPAAPATGARTIGSEGVLSQPLLSHDLDDAGLIDTARRCPMTRVNLDLPPVPGIDDIDIDDDDRPVGRWLSRREVLALFGAGGVAVAAAACAPGATGSAGATATPGASATASAIASASAAAVASAIPSCVVVPELTEGPYYLDVDLERSDIRANTADGAVSEGAVLELGWLVSQVDGEACVPLEGVIVDVWHCDALGVYSGVQGDDGDFLRGHQKTDANGAAAFTTIYPGWYSGRAVHIHFKIRTDPDADAGFEATSQLFFDDALSAEVFSSGVYAAKGTQDTPNDADSIFGRSGGTTLLDIVRDGDVYRATFSLAIRIA